MRVIFTDTVDDVLEPIIKHKVEWIAKFFPGWAQDLIVVYHETTDKDTTASVQVFYQYRYINLYIYPAFLTDKLWKETLFHELVHVLMTPYTRKFENVVETMVDPSIQAYLRNDISEAEEAVCQDMAKLLTFLEKADIIEE